MEEKLKNLVKEAVMEALAEVMNQEVAVMSADSPKKDSDNKEEDKKKPIRPEPSLGVGGFSLRN